MQFVDKALAMVQSNGPAILKPIAIFIVGWLLAKVLAWVTKKALVHLEIDKKAKGTSDSLSNTVYWLVLLFILPALLEALSLQELLHPVQGMLNKFLNHVPNIIAAGLILFVGTIVAKIVKELVVNLAKTTKLDSVLEKFGSKAMFNGVSASSLLGMLVNVLIMIPVFIAALGALQIEAITGPAVEMLSKVFDLLPNLITAGFMLAIGLFIGKYCAKVISQLLAGFGFDSFIEQTGIKNMKPTASAVVGNVTLAAIMLFLAIEAASILQLTQIADMLSQFMGFAGNIVIALIVMILGLMLANKSSAFVSDKKMANITRAAIIVFVAGISLDYTGLAPEGLMSNAFSLAVGAAAVAAAIAFGIGGRDVAKQKLEKWF